MPKPAYMLIQVATSRDAPKVHLVKQTPLSLLYTCIMKKYVHIYMIISPPQFSLIIFIRKMIIVISMFKLLMYRC